MADYSEEMDILQNEYGEREQVISDLNPELNKGLLLSWKSLRISVET